MSTLYSSDDEVRRALEGALGPAEPPASVDRALRRYARGRAGGRWQQSPWFVWPASAAAATVVAMALVALMHGMIPATEGPAAAPPLVLREPLPPGPPDPPVTGDAGAGSLVQSGSLAHRGLPPSITLAEPQAVREARRRLSAIGEGRSLERLAELARAAPLRDGELLVHYVAFRAEWPDATLPAEVERTIAGAIGRRLMTADTGSP